MARQGLTEEAIEEFRARAVAAATRLFAERGYDGVSMRSLANELACSPMTPYRYFDNKDALFARVRTEAFRRFADGQARAAAEPAPRLRLRRLADAYLRFAVSEPEAYRIMFQLDQLPAEHYPDLEAEQYRAFSYLLGAVEELVAAGAMQGDALTQAHLLWAQVHGLASLHLAGKLTMGRTIEQLCGVAFGGDEE